MEELKTNSPVENPVARVSIKATIPIVQYGNIIPEVELTNIGMREGIEYGLSYIKELFARYSEKGALTERDTSVIVKLKSFNEEGVEVDFDATNHTFTYKRKVLTSATNYIKRFYKEFQMDSIATASAKSWGVNEGELKDLWKSNGDLTAAMGSVVHKALEHYDKYRNIGEAVKAKKELADGYQMPKHPLLQSIIKGFIELDTTKGEVMNEVLLTDIANGFCGLADRVLITGEKKCRIQDYKINVDSMKTESSLKCAEPFDKLPGNKITKYQLQCNFYSQILKNSGWIVEGIDVFVFEEKWKHYELPLLDSIY